MKTLLFDENASDTNNNFHVGFNTTIRRGSKYVRDFEIGNVVEFKNLKGEILGSGIVAQMIVGPVEYIPLKVMEFEHDPKCRNISGLIEVLQNCYNDPTIDFKEIVTAIVLLTEFSRSDTVEM